MRLFRNRGQERPGDEAGLPPGPVTTSRPLWFRHPKPPAPSQGRRDDRVTATRQPSAPPAPARKATPANGNGRRKAPKPKQPITFGWEYLPRQVQPKSVRGQAKAPRPKAPVSFGLDHVTKKPSGGSGARGWSGPIDGSHSGWASGWGRLY